MACAQFIANWEDAAKGLFQRVYRESVGRVIDEKNPELLAALLAYPDVKTDWEKTDRAERHAGSSRSAFVRDGQVLNYFSMVTTSAPLKPSPRRNCASNACFRRMRPRKPIISR